MYKPILSLAAGALLAFSMGASASVVYHWQSVSNTEHNYTKSGGDLVVSDKAWRSGSLNEHWEVPVPSDVDIEKAWPGDTFYRMGMDINEFGGGTSPRSENPYNAEGLPYFNASLEFNHHLGILTGDVEYEGAINSMALSSDENGLWTIDYFASDGDNPMDDFDATPHSYPYDEFDDVTCHSLIGGCGYRGATGRWIIDPSTIPTPEPSTLALFGLSVGLLGFGVTRRRKYPDSKA